MANHTKIVLAPAIAARHTYEMRMTTQKHWLAAALKAAGRTQQELADELGVAQPRISEIIRGARRVAVREVSAIAEFLSIPAAEVAKHIGINLESISIRVAWYIGAGEKFYPAPRDEVGESMGTVDLPVDASLEGAIVRGRSMEPVYREGDVVIYSTNERPPDELIGRECIVCQHDGPTYLKILKRHRKRGHFTLESYSADPIVGVQIDWARPIEWVRRGR